MKRLRKKDPGPQSQRSLLRAELPGVRRIDYSGFIEPCLATLVDRPPRTDDWVHEIKFDGYRTQLHLHDARPKAFTRRGYDWTSRFKNLLDALVMLATRECIIDGEAVVEDAQGRTDFGRLQNDLAKGGSDRVVYYAFDLLYLDDADLRRVPLIERKELLRELIGTSWRQLRLSEHITGNSGAIFKEACELGLEGLVSKRANGAYVSGRSNAWTKVTCRKRETYLIAGYALKNGRFDGLYLARRAGDRLRYAGKVERGFSEEAKRDVRARLEPLVQKSSPLADKIKKPKARWVKPALLADVEYRALTEDGLMRHPAFKGLREDLTKRKGR